MKKLFASAVVLLAAWTVSAQNIVTSDTTLTVNSSRSRPVRIAVQGGYAYRAGKVDQSQGPDMAKYLKGLKHGYTYGADLTWFFLNNFGVGVKGNVLHVSNAAEGTLQLADGTQHSGRIEDKIDIWFVGPFASWRVTSRNMRHTMLMNAGLGYLGCNDKTVVIEPFKMSGGTLGILYEVGYDFSLSDTVAIGAMLSCIGGTMGQYNVKYPDGSSQLVKREKGSYENLSHINFSIGLRINL